MSKTKRRSAADRSATTDLVSQIECAIRYPQATLIGALIGGVIPWFARTLAHEQVPHAWSSGNHGLAAVMIAVVLGCALFSAITVYKFGRAAFGDSRKALGFTLALEGVMLVSTGGTSAAALAVLIAINALANGSVIALAREATCKKREAVRRASETRRSRSSSSHGEASPPTRPAPVRVAPSRRPANVPGLVKVPARWTPADVIDAEIVSEELYS